jgi:hypothetical protein
MPRGNVSVSDLCEENQRGRFSIVRWRSAPVKSWPSLVRATLPKPCPGCCPYQSRLVYSAFKPYRLLPYGKGTLITVFTMVNDALSATALPFSVVIGGVPAVENEIAAEAIMVPTMVPPPAPLIVAELPTCQ